MFPPPQSIPHPPPTTPVTIPPTTPHTLPLKGSLFTTSPTPAPTSPDTFASVELFASTWATSGLCSRYSQPDSVRRHMSQFLEMNTGSVYGASDRPSRGEGNLSLLHPSQTRAWLQRTYLHSRKHPWPITSSSPSCVTSWMRFLCAAVPRKSTFAWIPTNGARA